MSASEPNDPGAAAARAYRELEVLVHHLVDELAFFRRRALAAEARARALEEASPYRTATPEASLPVIPDRAPANADARVAELELENAELRRRVEKAGARTRQLLERVRFLRQQHGVGGSA